MKSILRRTPIIRVPMDRVLVSAVVLSWSDLLHPLQRGPIQIEYAPGTNLRSLKIWQLTGRGEWNLICEYRVLRTPTSTPSDRLTFSNGYHSAGLAEMLEVIMQYRNNFAPSLELDIGSIQVTPPQAHDLLAAVARMRHVYESFGLTFAYIPAAALA